MCKALEQLKTIEFGVIAYDYIYEDDYNYLTELGYNVYSIRHSDFSQDEMASIEPNVRVNHYADLIVIGELKFDKYNTIILDEDVEDYINKHFYHTVYTKPFMNKEDMARNLINDLKNTNKEGLIEELIGETTIVDFETNSNTIVDYFIEEDKSVSITPFGQYFYTRR